MINKLMRFLLLTTLSSLIFIFISCSPFSPDTTLPEEGLIITEVGGTYYYNVPIWLEIYNSSSNALNLGNYNLRCYAAYVSGANTLSLLPDEFTLPNKIIHPGTFAILYGDPENVNTSSDKSIFINKIEEGRTTFPYIKNNGAFFFELTAGNVTYDFVQSGSSVSPTSGQFSGDTPALILSNGNDYGKSIARKRAFTDSDSASDWSLVTVSTPGGPNDVTNGHDTDGDGIPDANEMPGSTFVGLPLYDWGARADTKDIFIYLCYMSSEDRGIIPQKAALDKIVTAFSNKNIRVHFDVGNLFDQTSGINAINYDLSDTTHAVPYLRVIDINTGFRNYKNAYMPIDKRQIFHHVLFGDKQEEDNSLGIAEIMGNDILISLGSVFSANTPSNFVINYQAGTLMHELGHNFGLRHGGDEDQNYKPNYYSVMNYLYALNGLPPAGNPGDRYHYQIGHIKTLSNLSNGPSSDLFKIDYSDGMGLNLNENSLNEGLGIGRNLGAIDWNTNGTTNDNNVSQNINPEDNNNINVISKYDDWSNLYFTFYRTGAGSQLNLPDSDAFVFKMFSQNEDKIQPWMPPCRFPMEQ